MMGWRPVIAWIAWCSLTCPSEAQSCRLTIELVDARSHSPLAGVVQVRNPAGVRVALPELLDRGTGVEPEYPIHDWSVLPQRSTITLPAGEYTLRAFAGLETDLASTRVSCRDSVAATVPLSRFYHAAERGYAAGNTHLHLQRFSAQESDRYLLEIPRADGLDLVFVSYLERAGADTAYSSNRYSFDDLRKLSTPHVHFRGGQELRHNFGAWNEGYGHVLLLNIRELIRPVSLGPGITGAGTDGLSLKQGIERGHALGGTVIWAHNNWGLEDIPNWLMGRIDAMNLFDGDDSTLAMRTYRRAFYRYLNAGLHVPFSSGTDWFMYDFSRAYVRGSTGFSPEQWLRDLKAGRSFISNGPLLELEVDRHRPGDVMDLAGPGTVHLVGKAIGRIDFKRIEVIQDGEVVAQSSSRPQNGHFVAEIRLPVRVTSPMWLALRTPSPFAEGETHDPPAPGVPLNEFGRELFGHTSPVYVRVRGREAFQRSTALDLLHEMETNRSYIEGHGRFADQIERDRVLGVYDEGIVALRKRLQKAGGPL